MKLQESRTLEFKREINKGYLKTVSAFANYVTGEIIFGIEDNGIIIGVENPQAETIKIENQINDNLKPVPNFLLNINNDKTITLKVFKGDNTPYLYNGKAYKRADTSTVEIDSFQIKRLIMTGTNQYFEQLPAANQRLKFNYLEKKMINKIGISELNLDIIRTFNLFHQETGYNLAAELCSDNNTLEGIEYVRFGNDINNIFEHKKYETISIIEQMDDLLQQFDKYYRYEIIDAPQRNIQETIPMNALRETIANAVVHREWDIRTTIKVSMYKDRVEIVSPGGLPNGITAAEYLNGQLSILRNPILANVMFRLGYIEKFGTGIRRIMASYQDSYRKPEFKFFDNSIVVSLPLISNELPFLDSDANELYKLFLNNSSMKRSEIEIKTGFNKAKTVRILNKLIAENLLARMGKGPEARYHKK